MATGALSARLCSHAGAPFSPPQRQSKQTTQLKPTKTLYNCTRHWISRVAPLLLDKTPEVRGMATKALQAAYDMDPMAVSDLLSKGTAVHWGRTR